MNRFIILSQQRSGSHMLMNILNSHPKIHCNSDSQTADIKKNGKGWTYDVGFDDSFEVSGFLLKIKTDLYKKINPEENIKIIYLKRDNLLHILLSKKMAKLFGCYEKEVVGITTENARAARELAGPISISIEEAEQFFYTWHRKHKDVLRKIDKLDYIKVDYDNLCEDMISNIKSIYEFIGIEYSEIFFSSGRGAEKLDPRNIEYSIENYEELKKYFSTTKWAKFFK